MALMNMASAPAADVPTEPAPGAPAAPAPGGQPAPAEGNLDEAQVEQFVDAGLQIIYGGETADGELNDGIAGMLRGEGQQDATQALANTAAEVAATAISDALDRNISLDPAAAFAGLMQLVGELASVAGEEGIYDFDQRETDAAATRAGEVLHGLTEELGFFNQEQMMSDAGDLAEASHTPDMDQAIGAIEQADSPGSAPAAGGGGIMRMGAQ